MYNNHIVAERLPKEPHSPDQDPHLTPTIDWDEISSIFDRKFKPSQKEYIAQYLEAQIMIKKGDIEEARALFEVLGQDQKYLDFESDNEDVLAWLRSLVHDTYTIT